jgi:plasmid stabilization system protein ParE
VARKVLRRSRATQDLLEQALFIANDNLDAAERFLDAAEAAFARLLEMPEIGVARA